MNELRAAIIDHVGMKAGMEIYDENLCLALHQAGCDAEVFSNFSPAQHRAFIHPVFPFKERTPPAAFFEMWKVYGRLRKELAARHIRHCILHVFRFSLWEEMLIRRLAVKGMNLYLVIHDLESLVGFKTSSRRRNRIFGFSRKLIVHNRFSHGELMKIAGERDKKKIVLIPHGNFLNPGIQAETGSDNQKNFQKIPGKKHLLFFGHLKPTKGLDLLLDAMSRIHPSIQLVIAGRDRGLSFRVYEEMIANRNLENRVTVFNGFIPPEMRNHLFREADAVVIPYRRVYQSGVLLMAMSFGKAVVASDLPPNREVIRNEENGLLFENGNATALADAVNRVMQDEELRSRLAGESLQYVKSEHDWRQIAETWKNIISE